MKYALLLISIVSLSGCVVPHHHQPRWYKDGVSSEEAHNRHAKCTYDVGMNKVDLLQEQTLIKACMEADGFRWGVPYSGGVGY